MTNFKKLFIIFFVLFSCSNSSPDVSLCSIGLVNTKGKLVDLRIETAETDMERSIGLMYRKKLPYNQGMLFVFSKPQKLSFWMKNTYLPLSIAYISENCLINEIYDMKPLDTSVIYPSKMNAKYALEVNRGWFEANKIKAGSRIIFNGCISK